MTKSNILLLIVLLSIGSVSAQQESTPNLDKTSIVVDLDNAQPQVTSQNKAAGDCNIGYESDVPNNGFPGSYTANSINGTKHTLLEEGTLNSINVVGRTTGETNVRMFVYDDLSGVPNDLIAVSEIAPLIIGTVTLPVTPVVLSAGDYWIMFSFDGDGEHLNRKYAPGTYQYYDFLTFGNTPPSNASSFTITGPWALDFPVFLDINCTSTIGIKELNKNVASIYPNPSSENITIELNESIFMDNIELIDGSGRIVKSFRVQQLTNSKTVDISSIEPGIYALKIAGNNQVITKSIFIK